MPRRKTVHRTTIKGTGKVDYTIVWRVFECYCPGCDNLMKISEDWLLEQKEKGSPIKVICSKCGYAITDEIIERTPRWKYCRVCEWLQPLENFHKHKPSSSSFRSGRQLECRFCKNLLINPTLNPLRTSDQFRESSQRRRLYNVLSEEIGKINSKKIFEKFESKCFNCNKDLTYKVKGIRDWTLDHTLPARYFWPLTTDNATLLCNDCNNLKHDKWPSEIYNKEKIKKMAVLTGYSFELLSNPPKINPKALQKILANVDKFIEDWIKYPEDIKKVRKLILEMEGVDIYERAKHVPDYLKD